MSIIHRLKGIFVLTAWCALLPFCRAQVDYRHPGNSYPDYPCLHETIAFIDTSLVDLIPKESAGLILVYTVEGEMARVQSVFLDSSSGIIDARSIEDYLLTHLPSVRVSQCENLSSPWFALPVAIPHSVHSQWPNNEASDLRRSAMLVNLYSFITSFEPDHLLRTFFVHRKPVIRY